MQSMEVVILDDRWPRLQCLVKLPNNQVFTEFFHYDGATTQFVPNVTRGLTILINQVLERKGIKPKAK